MTNEKKKIDPIDVKIPENLTNVEAMEYLKNLLPKEKQNVFDHFVEKGLIKLDMGGKKEEKVPSEFTFCGPAGNMRMPIDREQFKKVLKREQERYDEAREESILKNIEYGTGYLIDLGLADLVVYLEQAIKNGMFFTDFLHAALIKEIRDLKEEIKK